jgi:hypothetical protein
MKLYEDILSVEEIDLINKAIDSIKIPIEPNGEYIAFNSNGGTGICKDLGRLQIADLTDYISEDINNKLNDLANSLSDENLSIDHILYAEYSNKYGSPNLPPHFDGDTNELIINFQLSSNVSWDLGLNLQTYKLKDNSAFIFNGNTNIHWRPHKKFKDGEYVRMMFIRFYNTEKRSDYSYLPIKQDDDIFNNARVFRDSLQNP